MTTSRTQSSDKSLSNFSVFVTLPSTCWCRRPEKTFHVAGNVDGQGTGFMVPAQRKNWEKFHWFIFFHFTECPHPYIFQLPIRRWEYWFVVMNLLSYYGSYRNKTFLCYYLLSVYYLLYHYYIIILLSTVYYNETERSYLNWCSILIISSIDIGTIIAQQF